MGETLWKVFPLFPFSFLFFCPNRRRLRSSAGSRGRAASHPGGRHAGVPSRPEWSAAGQSGGGHGSPDGPVPCVASGDSRAQRGGGAGRASANFNRPHLINI